MNLLLDTHVLLWWDSDNPNLGEVAKATIANPDSPTRDESPTRLMIRPLPPAPRWGAAAWQQWIAP